MLYYEKPYLKRFKAHVLKRESGKFLLNDTILYEGGGGQPADIGYVNCEGKEVEIRHLGGGWHKYNCELSDDVEIIIDWDFRYLMMKSHTAEHTFFRFLQSKGAKLVKISLGEESSIFFKGDLSEEDILEAERRTRELIFQGREVRTFWIDKKDAEKYEDLRINWERIKDSKIRIVEIEDHDLSACKGIHVKNLREIGDFIVTRFRKGKTKEVKFMVGDHASSQHHRYSVEMRKIAWKNNVDIEKIDLFVENLKNENLVLQEILRKETVENDFNEVECKDTKIFWQIFYDDRIGVRKAMEKVKDGDVVIFGNPLKNSVSCAYNPQSPQIRDVFMLLLKKYGGKGGGKGNFLSGATNEPQSFIDEFIRELCNGEN